MGRFARQDQEHHPPRPRAPDGPRCRRCERVCHFYEANLDGRRILFRSFVTGAGLRSARARRQCKIVAAVDANGLLTQRCSLPGTTNTSTTFLSTRDPPRGASRRGEPAALDGYRTRPVTRLCSISIRRRHHTTPGTALWWRSAARWRTASMWRARRPTIGFGALEFGGTLRRIPRALMRRISAQAAAH